MRLEECRRQCKEQQEQLNIKEIALAESKRNIERIKISHDDEIKVGDIYTAKSQYLKVEVHAKLLNISPRKVTFEI